MFEKLANDFQEKPIATGLKVILYIIVIGVVLSVARCMLGI